MQMIQCPNCGKLSGFKRALGFGTLFMVVLTAGLWLLVIPFYPARCINCGLTRSSATKHSFLLPVLVVIGLVVFGAIRNATQHSARANDIDSSPSASITNSSATPSDGSQSTHTNEVIEDRELHLVPNLFGRGAISDGRTYSIALISSYYGKIPPATTLFVQGVIRGRYDANVLVLADEQESKKELLCSMSPSESEDVDYYYHSGETVQATGSYGVTNLGLPILRDCTVASAAEKVVRPLSVTPEAKQSLDEQNQNSQTNNADIRPQAQPRIPDKVVSLPASQPTRVTWGQTPDEVLAILGPPTAVTMGVKRIYLYPHLKLVFVDGKVAEIYQLGDNIGSGSGPTDVQKSIALPGSPSKPTTSGDVGGGLYRVGGGVSAPIPLNSIVAGFSDEARRNKLQGSVLLTLIVDPQGNPQNVTVSRSLGMGLDEKAIEAVRQYRFKPAMLNGNPVAVRISTEVNFRLY
jgi:TonB family protein